MKNTITRTITAGLLIRKQIKRDLEKAKFYGYNITWFEEKGFLESIFHINGSYEHVMYICDKIFEHYSD